MISTESRPWLQFVVQLSSHGGEGAAHTSTRIQFNNSTNINAFHVYIFPVTSVWITLQRDDILRQGKPATLSRQSINQRKIIRNIFHKAPATRHQALPLARVLVLVLVLVLTPRRWRRCSEAARMRNWRWKNERLQPFGSQINTKHQTTDRQNFMLFRLFTKTNKSRMNKKTIVIAFHCFHSNKQNIWIINRLGTPLKTLFEYPLFYSFNLGNIKSWYCFKSTMKLIENYIYTKIGIHSFLEFCLTHVL